MGLDVDAIILCQPDNGEMALEVVDQLVRSNAVDVIAIDSVAALVPRAKIGARPVPGAAAPPPFILVLFWVLGSWVLDILDFDFPL